MRFDHLLDNVPRHGGVNLSRQFDKSRVLSVLTGLPSQVKRVNRDAVAAEAGVERHESERLGFRCIDDFPDVDSHGAVHCLEFVDQGDVDAPKSVFEELGGLSGATR